ncbi:entericidin A/B family lipoprotein [Azospirillum oryzae]|nr:entericidin A/B family lipoprotein [Azospirillum sp. Sh1]KAA0591634.1 entericidin A/B family lipoprotein [Azospirillum oryzae]QCG99079.1 entericidin A/B family lipoprotein [Azospirillum sp. TSA2s]QKS53214.1 entericidin A/B family lipoprotein [Azospirillum oryzae]
MALAAMLTGCNTVEGAGQDLQSGGRAIERTAE